MGENQSINITSFNCHGVFGCEYAEIAEEFFLCVVTPVKSSWCVFWQLQHRSIRCYCVELKSLTHMLPTAVVTNA